MLTQAILFSLLWLRNSWHLKNDKKGIFGLASIKKRRLPKGIQKNLQIKIANTDVNW
jgi:hypothetical protein